MSYPQYDNFGTNDHLRRRRHSVGYNRPPEYTHGGLLPNGYATQDYPIPHRQPFGYGTPPTASPFIPSEQPLYNDFPSGNPGFPEYQYQTYPPHGRMDYPFSRRAHDDIGLRDTYYPRERVPSTGDYTPAILDNDSRLRRRRHSTSIPHAEYPIAGGSVRPSSIRIQFKRKHAHTSGVTLRQAQANEKLSRHYLYHLHDMHTNDRGAIYLRVAWPGLPPVSYEIPLDGIDGYVHLQTLARRTSRAIAHFMQNNGLHQSSDRVELLYLDEVAYGVWQPALRVS